MATIATFNDIVAARTRAAEHILNSSDLLALYEKHGGLPGDLEAIAEAGHQAEVLTHLRGAVQAGGTGATLDVQTRFAEVQREYVAIMAVLQAVRRDLGNDGVSNDTLAAIDQVLADETPMVIRTVEKEGVKKKVAVRSKSHDALRAEIQKDAASLEAMKDVLKAMAKRKVTAARVSTLRKNAEALQGKLADRTAAKGAGKGATQEVRKAVHEQKQVWSACYRILAQVGYADERVRKLLADAAATR